MLRAPFVRDLLSSGVKKSERFNGCCRVIASGVNRARMEAVVLGEDRSRLRSPESLFDEAEPDASN